MQKKAFPQELIDLMQDRKNAYTLTFANKDLPHRTTVWNDLSKFCREKESTFHIDSRLHALIEGRREVLLRISDYINLTVDELCQKYGKG